jgi:hypothetical protein
MGDADHAAAGSYLRLLFEAGTVTGVSDRHLLERSGRSRAGCSRPVSGFAAGWSIGIWLRPPDRSAWRSREVCP